MATVGKDLEDSAGRPYRPVLGEDSSGNKYVLKTNTSGQTEVVGVAGTATIGKVGILKEVRVTTVIQTATGGAYAANEIVGSDECTTTATAEWVFAEVGSANGAYGYIAGATVISESESITPRLTLFLFNAAPTSAVAGSAANTAPDSADLAKYIGKIDFPAMESLGTTDSTTTVSPSTVGNIPLVFKCAAAADDLHGILVTRDIFTQTDGDDMTIILTVEQY